MGWWSDMATTLGKECKNWSSCLSSELFIPGRLLKGTLNLWFLIYKMEQILSDLPVSPDCRKGWRREERKRGKLLESKMWIKAWDVTCLICSKMISAQHTFIPTFYNVSGCDCPRFVPTLQEIKFMGSWCHVPSQPILTHISLHLLHVTTVQRGVVTLIAGEAFRNP